MTDESVSEFKAPDRPELVAQQERRRRQLLDAARTVFARHGYHRTTVSDIVRLAGLSQGTFYLYFPDKKSIFVTLREELFADLRAHLWKRTRETSDAIEKLRLGLAGFFDYHLVHQDWYRIVMREGQGLDPELEIRRQELLETLAADFQAALQQGVREGRIKVCDTSALAWALIGMGTQVADVLSDGSATRAEHLSRELFALVAQGMALERADPERGRVARERTLKDRSRAARQTWEV